LVNESLGLGLIEAEEHIVISYKNARVTIKAKKKFLEAENKFHHKS